MGQKPRTDEQPPSCLRIRSAITRLFHRGIRTNPNESLFRSRREHLRTKRARRAPNWTHPLLEQAQSLCRRLSESPQYHQF